MHVQAKQANLAPTCQSQPNPWFGEHNMIFSKHSIYVYKILIKIPFSPKSQDGYKLLPKQGKTGATATTMLLSTTKLSIDFTFFESLRPHQP